ncbi:MAG: type II toxin-antitoxin system VapC family toxin [Deltaproteobacteria bacterium]|nr:type II toxin-antitoxin system VapC family toxin [Deltaproteobacteria bacterium]
MLLLDTHAWVWLASDPSQLTERVKQKIQEEADQLYVSSISALEIALLAKRERLILPLSPSDFVEKSLSHHGIQEIPVNYSIAIASASLPDVHNDPFDRMIIATALLHKMTLISKDAHIAKYPNVKVLWGEL